MEQDTQSTIARREIGATKTYSDEDVRDIARICHEANRVYCQTIGDWTQRPWDESPAWQQVSAENGVRAHLAVPGGLDPRRSHESWLAEKIATGWTYGPVKDSDKKEHPCCVDYDQLPREQQAKDRLFGAIVEALR